MPERQSEMEGGAGKTSLMKTGSEGGPETDIVTLFLQVRKAVEVGYRYVCPTKETKHPTAPGEPFGIVCVCACVYGCVGHY